MWIGVRRHAPSAVPPWKTCTRCIGRLGGPQARRRRMRKISPPAGIRTPDRPARSKSLYRLSYPGNKSFKCQSGNLPSLKGKTRLTASHKRHKSYFARQHAVCIADMFELLHITPISLQQWQSLVNNIISTRSCSWSRWQPTVYPLLFINATNTPQT
jgi:hypothetical protein